MKRTLFGARCQLKQSEKIAKRSRAPWLLVTSLEGGYTLARRIINLYKTRMQIEESFRDMMSSRWGLSLDEARGSSVRRYENLLLIGMLATLLLWLSGKVLELSKLHRRYQANTVSNRKVLSTFFLGARLFRQSDISVTRHDYQRALAVLQQQVSQQCEV